MSDLTLPRRAVACPGWRWLAGMLGDIPGVGPCRVLDVDDRGVPDAWWPLSVWKREGPGRFTTAAGRPGWCADVWGDAVPDLTDPCTLGGLEALVRERWGEDVYLRPLHTHSQPGGPGTDLMPVVWWALARGNDLLTVPRDPDGTGTRRLAGPTRAAALVAALEAP